MEDSKAQLKIINLGRAIVNELNLDPGVDTLSKWMAHYVGEKIELVEKSSGKKKEQAQKECVEIILNLWEHRWSIPQGKSFLINFEPLLETIEKLDPNKKLPFFFPPRFQKEFQKESENEVPHHAKDNYEMALKVDRLARSLISDLLNRAVSGLDLNKERREVIRRGLDLDSPDIQALRYVLYNKKTKESQESDMYDGKQERYAEIQRRIKDLEELSSFKNSLLERYIKELSELE